MSENGHDMRPLLLVTVALAAALPVAGGSTARPPNIVLVIADDQGWGDLSVHGNANLSTPRIDSLARDGARFQHFYVSPVCAPTRAELLTGRYHPRGGVYGTSARAERLDLDESTLAETLRAAGYATGAFGKWHNGSQSPYHPNDRGFDEFYGFLSGHWASYFDPLLDHNGRRVRGRGYLPDDLTDKALAFLDRQRRRPFFVYLAYNTPHSPMQVPDRFYRRFATAPLPLRHAGPEPEDLAHTRAALAMVENIDWNVGRILDRLDARQLARDTIVVYMSDNGPAGWRWNGGLKGRKGSLDEGGIRVPLLVRWPGRIRAGLTVPHIASAVDLLPTLSDLTGAAHVGGKPLDGRSVAPLLLEASRRWPDRRVFSYWGRRVSVRTDRFRLDPDGRLYDLPSDPGQQRDVAAQHPEVTTELMAAARATREELVAELGVDDRPLPVGHAARTELPAGDGVATGGIERSTRHPNASYFRNWSSTAGAVTWDVEVLKAGEYDVAIEYTCAPGDVGAEMEVSFKGRRVGAVVTKAHAPPPVGAEHDRVPRIESYTKDFGTLLLGTLLLDGGRGPLTLRAARIPGGHAVEVASLILTRR